MQKAFGGNKKIMTEDIVTFKGTKEGLYLIIQYENDLGVIKKRIQEKIASAQSFFQGVQKVNLKGTSLSQQDLLDLSEWLRLQYEIELNIKRKKENNQKDSDVQEGLHSYLIEDGMTKFINHTLRSGNRVEYNGNIVIIGDVNPGAEVIAVGNIIVVGVLRGIAHAGALGNKEAFVVAFSLQPTQLRISDIITRSPDQQNFKPTCPEKACIKENAIIILPYYKNIS